MSKLKKVLFWSTVITSILSVLGVPILVWEYRHLYAKKKQLETELEELRNKPE